MYHKTRKYFDKLVEPYQKIEDLNESYYLRLILTIDFFGILILIPIIIFRLIFVIIYQNPVEFVFTPLAGLIFFLFSWILGKTKFYKISYRFILIAPFLIPFTQLPIYF